MVCLKVGPRLYIYIHTYIYIHIYIYMNSHRELYHYFIVGRDYFFRSHPFRVPTDKAGFHGENSTAQWAKVIWRYLQITSPAGLMKAGALVMD